MPSDAAVTLVTRQCAGTVEHTNPNVKNARLSAPDEQQTLAINAGRTKPSLGLVFCLLSRLDDFVQRISPKLAPTFGTFRLG